MPGLAQLHSVKPSTEAFFEPFFKVFIAKIIPHLNTANHKYIISVTSAVVLVDLSGGSFLVGDSLGHLPSVVHPPQQAL